MVERVVQKTPLRGRSTSDIDATGSAPMPGGASPPRPPRGFFLLIAPQRGSRENRQQRKPGAGTPRKKTKRPSNARASPTSVAILGRRSGCVPAEPYPPPRRKQL